MHTLATHCRPILASAMLMLASAAPAVFAQQRDDEATTKNAESRDATPPPSGVLRELTGIAVNRALPSEVRLWTEAGRIEADGFTSIVLSVYGESQSGSTNPGIVSVVLVPDAPALTRAFELGEVHLAFEFPTRVVPGPRYYFSQSFSNLPVGFPSYRVYVYNTTEGFATVNVFAYLTR